MKFDIAKIGDWRAAANILGNAYMNAARAIELAAKQEAHFFERKLKEGMQSGAPGGKRYEPLSPVTLALRKFAGFKGTKPLIQTGAMLRSIHVVKRGALYFVGIDRSAKSADGESMVEIAEMHENGAGPFVVEMTPAARRYIAMALKDAGLLSGGGGGGGDGLNIAVIKIPARPTFGPVMEAYGKPADVMKRFEDRVAALLWGLHPRVPRKGAGKAPPEDKGGFLSSVFGGGGGKKKGGGGAPGRDPSTGRFKKRE